MASRLRMVGRIISSSPRSWAVERVDRAHPAGGDGLSRIVGRDLTRGRQRHEESGVEATRGADRRHPVRQVLETARSSKSSSLAIISTKPRAPTLTSRLRRHEPTTVGCVIEEPVAVLVAGDAAVRPLRRARAGRPRSRRGPRSRGRAAATPPRRSRPRRCRGAGVGLVHAATGKHVGAADEVTVQIAPKHQDLEPLGAVSQR